MSTATGETFRGEVYSYEDARKRVPEAWRREVATIVLSGGDTFERETWHRTGVLGLGRVVHAGPETLYRHFGAGAGVEPLTLHKKTWVWVAPDGRARPLHENYGKDEPPPLPKPNPRRATCSCGPHRCSSCGNDTWIECHGVADGYCTTCYERG